MVNEYMVSQIITNPLNTISNDFEHHLSQFQA